MEEDRLSIGRMASLNCISDKALRFYHDKGLLVPDRIDPNGRRYYSLEQCSTLDFIQQMQTTGLSLQDIKTIVDTGDESVLRRALAERIAELDHQLQVASAALTATREMLHGLDFFECYRAEAAPITCEHLPEQRIWEFPMGESNLPNTNSFDYEDALAVWLRDLRAIKIAIAETLDAEHLEIPLSLLFRNVGARYTLQACRDRSPAFASAFVVVPPVAWNALEDRLTIVPSGEYLTVGGRGMADEGTNERATIRAAQTLLRHAEENDLVPDGDFLIKVPSDVPALMHGKSEDIFQIVLRVEA